MQDFNVLLFEFFVVRTEPDDLILSATGEGKWQEGHDRAAATIGCKGEWIAQM